MVNGRYVRVLGRIKIETVILPMGKDICIVITGGNAPHLGAVAAAQARPSLKDSGQLSASTSVITLLGHKEDEVVRRIAHHAAKDLGTNVAVCCGIHVDHISEAEMAFVEQYIEEVRQWIKDRGTGSSA